jgi:hypothetical protein
MISGSNLMPSIYDGKNSYFFSKHSFTWGWATWSDRWNGGYDVDIRNWPVIRKSNWHDFINFNKTEIENWVKCYDQIYRGELDAWDYQWLLLNWMNKRYCVVPKYNQISNIGFGVDATHTYWSKDRVANLKIYELEGEIIHPQYIVNDIILDRRLYRHVFGYRLRHDLINKMHYVKRMIAKLPYGKNIINFLKKIFK